MQTLNKQTRAALEAFLARWCPFAIINEKRLLAEIKSAKRWGYTDLDLYLNSFMDNMSPNDKANNMRFLCYVSDLKEI